MKKLFSIIFFLTLFYVLPLAGKPELILNGQVLFLSLICSILFVTQPRLSISESREKKSSDKNTVWWIIIVSAIGQIVSIFEWAYFPLMIEHSTRWIMAGFVLLITGTIFRLYSIHVLGKYFSATVQIKKEHKIISKGPYKYLRHPSYTGGYIAMLGSAVFLQSVLGMLIFGIGMLFVYRIRIQAEEKTLMNEFNDDYKIYSNRTYKMFPFVW